jgi:hypothetical protein
LRVVPGSHAGFGMQRTVPLPVRYWKWSSGHTQSPAALRVVPALHGGFGMQRTVPSLPLRNAW